MAGAAAEGDPWPDNERSRRRRAYEFRRPMVEAALNGEEQWFIAEFDHATRGRLTVQTQYVPTSDARARWSA